VGRRVAELDHPDLDEVAPEKRAPRELQCLPERHAAGERPEVALAQIVVGVEVDHADPPAG
jgi:hypothetical protein